MAFVIGIDYGTNSVRALLVGCKDGFEAAPAVYDYPSGQNGVLLEPGNHHLARQNPADYLSGLEIVVKQVVSEALAKVPHFQPQQVIGLGVDTTGSSPMPVTENNVPLALLPQWKENLAAHCWLWKDHTSHWEAAEITAQAKAIRPHYLAKCGGVYSSEWFWAKIWHCLKSAPDVFDAAYSWVELADYIPSVLAGVQNPKDVVRGVCAAGHKAMYCAEWSGLPDKDFLATLDPKLGDLRDRLYETAWDALTPAGKLCPEWATKFGLPEGIPIAIGEFDVHYGAIGCGVEPGVLVKAIGTSTCDCGVMPVNEKLADIPGICGIVNGSILPGYFGLEAGQSAVGDIFKWFVEGVCEGDGALHHQLSEEAARLHPGQSGLLALDWNNGNRTILVDPLLTGLLVGTTLYTTRAEIYRALIEATAFGARVIIERMEAYGVPIKRVVCCGGIAEKNPLLMQIYADVTGRTMLVAGSSQTCALGAGIAATVLVGSHAGGYDSFAEAQRGMVRLKEVRYEPNPSNHHIYNQLFELYVRTHDAFGGVNDQVSLGSLMKELIRLKTNVSVTLDPN